MLNLEHRGSADENHFRREDRDSPDLMRSASYWIQIVRERWRVAALVWCMVMIAGAAVLWLMPRRFESTAKFLVRNARQEMIIDASDRTTPAHSDYVPEEVLNSELELLRSPTVLTTVVRRTGLDRPYRERGDDAGLAEERAVGNLARALRAGTIRQTNIIQVSFTDREPESAAKVVRELADAYLASHLSIHSSPGTYELFSRQAEEARQELVSAEENVAALAAQDNLVLPEHQRKSALELASAAEVEYQHTVAEITNQAARLRAAETKMLEVPQRIPTSVRALPNQYSAERLNSLIVELVNKRTSLLTKFNPNDRFITELDDQIRDTSAALDQATGAKASEESTDVNPAWKALELESLQARLALSGLAGKAAELRRQAAGYRKESLALTESMPRYDVLVRQVTATREKYELYSKKEEEARVSAALDQQRISNVVLAQAPYVAHIPVSPDVRFVLMVTVISATLLAFGAAIFVDRFVLLWRVVWHRLPAPALSVKA